jgi:4-hydroxy-2-oxoheptanedioate aldolase
MGVQGIQVPHVGDAATARAAVNAVRYPPLGERGMAAGSRAAEFGSIPLIDHMTQSNREILLACMIEDMAAVERIDEIAAVEGVDLLAVGPSDLSRSLGVSGQPDHPRLVAAIDRIREAVKKRLRCASRIAVEPCRLPAQCRTAQATRCRLYQLRANPGSPPAEIPPGSGR